MNRCINFFIAIILVLGGGCYFLWNENQTLTQNNVLLEGAVEQQQQAMDALQSAFQRQTTALNNMTARNAEIEADMNRYLDIFRRHNLNQLAEVRPGLVETRVNNGTKEVFDSIENDSKELNNLNTPSNNP
jgi:small-conductance mechanosensitive channel